MKITIRSFFRVAPALAAALLLAGFPLGATAQDEELPTRVGRLADLGGNVYVSTEEKPEDWVQALRNYSVTSGDNLWVSEDGRAEVDYGGGQFRLAGNTNVHVARLDDNVLALFVAHGRVIVRVRVMDAGDAARIDTPNTQLTLTRSGLYRIEVSEDRERTAVVVREGEATVSLSGGVQQVLPGQTATVDGADASYADVRSGFGVDGFDSWSADRDRRYERSRSAQYVSRQMVGYSDLDDYGRWDTTQEYGAVWYPTTVASGWAPYRYGRWSWVGGFGWTWVDDAPWGYAPFHYGRWIYVGNRWGWAPGGYVPRPVWAPALVGWYGGSGWTASVSYGAPVYGWVPLGWGEPYVPSWRRCSDRCWTRYNRPYAVNHAERRNAPPTRYVNWSAPGGATAVPSAIFTGRQPVHANVVAVRPQTISSAPLLRDAPVLPKPTAATIPGARPTLAAPPPAVRFQTKPLQLAPAGRPTWGNSAVPRGQTSAPPAVARPGSPAPAVNAAPGTWGAPTPRPAPASPQANVPNRAEVQRSAPPATYTPQPSLAPRNAAQPAPATRSAPPATTAPQPSAVPRSAPPATYATQPSVAPRSAPPASYAPQPSLPPRSAPPATYAPQPSVAPRPQPSAAPAVRSVPPVHAPQPSVPVARPATPEPQVTRSAPSSKPSPRGEADKPVPR